MVFEGVDPAPDGTVVFLVEVGKVGVTGPAITLFVTEGGNLGEQEFRAIRDIGVVSDGGGDDGPETGELTGGRGGERFMVCF